MKTLENIAKTAKEQAQAAWPYAKRTHKRFCRARCSRCVRRPRPAATFARCSKVSRDTIGNVEVVDSVPALCLAQRTMHKLETRIREFLRTIEECAGRTANG